MNVRVVHYGVDTGRRLGALRSAGFTVESCNSLDELRWLLREETRTDVIAFSESLLETPFGVMAIARSHGAPLVLFEGWVSHLDESQFDLVIPALASAEQCVAEITRLIENSGLVHSSSPSQAARLGMESRILPAEAPTLTQKITLKVRWPAGTRDRSPAFDADRSPAEASPPDSAAVSRTTGFLGLLDSEEMIDLNALFSISAYPAGAVLFAEQDLPDAVYFLLSGQVKLSVNSSNGKRFIVHIARPGEVLGLVAVFTACAHEFTAEACYPCYIASADRAAFLSFLEQHPHAFRAATSELARAYNKSCGQLRTLGVGFSVTARMAELILEWSIAGHETERGTQIFVALNNLEIGQCIGASRETVTRVLGSLQQRGIIDQKGSILTILDRAALESCAFVYYP